MLLYLNAATWTRGPDESAKLANDIKLARKFGVHVLLAHEQPNVADGLDGHTTSALGVPFDAFFNNPEGTTPRRLLVSGIYTEIAVPLKRGPYRPVSMALLAKAVAANPAAKKTVKVLTAKRGSSGGLLSPADNEAMDKDADEVQPLEKSILRKLDEAIGWGTHRTKMAMEEFGVPSNPLPPGVSSMIFGDEKQLEPVAGPATSTPRPGLRRESTGSHLAPAAAPNDRLMISCAF